MIGDIVTFGREKVQSSCCDTLPVVLLRKRFAYDTCYSSASKHKFSRKMKRMGETAFLLLSIKLLGDILMDMIKVLPALR